LACEVGYDLLLTKGENETGGLVIILPSPFV
jgi:hypothetical protein